MSIRVTDFKWEKGKNDLEYIELLEKNLDAMMDKFRECSKVAREQYNKGKADERAKTIDEIKEAINEHLFDSPMMNPIMTRNEILLFLEQLKSTK